MFSSGGGGDQKQSKEITLNIGESFTSLYEGRWVDEDVKTNEGLTVKTLVAGKCDTINSLSIASQLRMHRT